MNRQTSGADIDAFIGANTEILTPPLVPEIRLYLATEMTPIWQATEEELETRDLAPPFWAFCWPGGQALARHVLDTPEVVRDRHVLDFASGCAVSGIAAAMAGARRTIANDIDEMAIAAARLNAQLNSVKLDVCADDLVEDGADGFDVILAGDIFYERTPSRAIERFLRERAAAGATVLIGDPGRTYLPRDGLREVARFDVPTSRDLEDRDMREGIVWQVV